MATSISSKKANVQKLMLNLEKNLTTKSLTNSKCAEILEQLKVHGRDPRGADAIYSATGIKTLCAYAFGDYEADVYREALKCVANALLLQEKLRTVFVDLGHTTSIAKVYQNQNNDDEFLGARILFLLTYGTKADFVELMSSEGLVDSIDEHLRRHTSSLVESENITSQMENMAVSESLKLIFNLANQLPQEIGSLSTTVPSILSILLNTDIETMPLETSIGVTVNALAILEFNSLSTPSAGDAAQEQYGQAVPKLVEILLTTIDTYTASELDTKAIPLMTVLRNIYTIASSHTRVKMQKLLLPNDRERDLPLGKSSSLASRLLRLTAVPSLSNLPEAISSLMFQMSNEDANTFVKNIGYGYAAGYLMTHKIPIPEGANQARTDSTADQVPINPVTGQRLDKEESPDLPEMTEEEKEREAERLFVLFERLKATGVVDVINPVQQARDEGRFEDAD